MIEHLVEHGIIAKQRAFSAYQAMQEEGRRLPWDLAYKRLKEFQSGCKSPTPLMRQLESSQQIENNKFARPSGFG